MADTSTTEDAVFRIIEHEAPYAGIISKEAV